MLSLPAGRIVRLVEAINGHAAEPIGARIKRLREAAGLSLGALAAKIGTPSGRQLVYGWEGPDAAVPSSTWIVPLARALGCSVEYLLTGHEPEPASEPVQP